MAHPNEESLRRGYDAFGKGDIDTVMSLLTDDTLWHIPGRNRSRATTGARKR
jgi:ketosteroid isomerase-like protein